MAQVGIIGNLMEWYGINPSFRDITVLERGGINFETIAAPGACVAALIVAAGNVDNGNHSYKIAFVTAGGQTELGAASNVVLNAAGSNQNALTAIPIGRAGVTRRRIYRTKAGGTIYYYLDEIADNITTTYTDNTADVGITIDETYRENTTGAFIYRNGVFAGHLGWLSTRFGLDAGTHLTTGALTAFGRMAGHKNTTGHSTCIGDQAGTENTTGRITAVGDSAGALTTAADAVMVGYYAGYNNLTGNIVAVGSEAARSITAGGVVAVGYQCFYHLTNNYCTAIGYKAGFSATTAAICAIGYQAAYSATTGGEVLAIGYNAAFAVTTGIMLCIGHLAGYGVAANAPVTDTFGILIGYEAGRSVVSATVLTNYIGIGYGVLIDKSNQVKIGNASITEINLHLTALPTGANNAAAQAAGILVGGLYRTNADPSVVCIRSA